MLQLPDVLKVQFVGKLNKLTLYLTLRRWGVHTLLFPPGLLQDEAER